TTYAQETLPPDNADKLRAKVLKQQVEEAQKQAKDEMQKANEEMQKANGDIQAAHAQMAKSLAEAGARDRLFQMFPSGQSRSLVILSSEMDAKVEAQLEEDLGIMAHIFDKALEEELGAQGRGRAAMGINLVFGPSAGARNLYLEGYGAVFMLNVGFPLQS